MNKLILTLTMALATSACGAEFNPDLSNFGETGSGTEGEDSAGDGDSAGVETGVDSGVDTDPVTASATDTSSTGDGDGDATTDSTESTGDGDGDGDGDPYCGDNTINGDGEECDGSDLGEMDCALVLEQAASGTLGCFDDCSFDVSSCSLNGSQPETGLFSDCEVQEDCTSQHPNWGCYTHQEKFCTAPCDTVADCGPSPGGTAPVVCSEYDWCMLDCSDGQTCPDGMGCFTQNGESFCA